jgi:Predicted transcriptional regulators
MYTIGQLCDKAAISRGTLLYYDQIGLLKPSTRTAANYRCYSEQDLEKLRQICLYRETGMPLTKIRQILESAEDDTDLILGKHLQNLNQSMRKLQIQRQIIERLTVDKEIMPSEPGLTKDIFIEVLYKTGLNDIQLAKLHCEFERSFPEEHQVFLELLGMPGTEIARIRENCSK